MEQKGRTVWEYRWSCPSRGQPEPIERCLAIVAPLDGRPGSDEPSFAEAARLKALGGGRTGSTRIQYKEEPMATEETGQATGTKDKDYNLIWFTEQSLSNALRLESYVEDAERDGDDELAEFFRRAQSASRKGGEQGKDLLRKRFAG
jgi:hypothetical protein